MADLILEQLAAALAVLLQRQGRMPPWIEADFFNAPNVILTVLTGGSSGQQVAPANPNRVGLILTSGQAAWVSPSSTVGPNQGIATSSSLAALKLTQASWGNLVSAAWYGASTIGTSVVAIEVILREWPRG